MGWFGWGNYVPSCYLEQSLLSHFGWRPGISQSEDFQQGIIGQVALKISFGRESLWREAIDRKFGSAWGCWCSNDVWGSYGVEIWKFIRTGKALWGMCVLLWVKAPRAFSGLIFGVVTCPLIVFPAIFWLASDQFAAISNLFYRSNGMIQGDICLSKAVQDWKIDKISTFLSFLYSLDLTVML